MNTSPPPVHRDGCHVRVRSWRCAALAALLSATAFAAEPATVRLQPAANGTAFDGWGTSLCWFGNAVGRWPEPQRSKIADALFSPTGLALTVVRYNIGGGEKPGHHHMPWFRQMDGFEPSPGAWTWDADPGQRWMLEAAIKRGANRVEAFSNSPPYWMTVSQCASGGVDPNKDNLDPIHEADFAAYLTEVVAHFQTAWGVHFDTLDPFNEPNTDYWRENHNQEGCHFDPTSQARFVRQLRAALDRKGLSSVKISASDETNPTKAIASWTAYDATARACVAQVNTHVYDTDHRTELRALIRESGKPLVMSEVDGAGDDRHDHAGIKPGLWLAKQIIDDLHYLQPLRWVFWQAVEDEGGQAGSNKNWGLIHADLAGRNPTWELTKKYHALAQFSKFIRPGATLIPCDAKETIAAWDRTEHRVIIVTRNAEPTDQVITYDLSSFGTGAAHVEVYRTSAKENVATLPAGTAEGGKLTATAAAESVTTYVVGMGGK